MKNFFLLLLFSICCFQKNFAQEILISSKNDKKPIVFANVVYLKNDSIKGGNYTNENGKILLDLKPEINFLEISCIGFETLKIERKNIQSNIFLEENATQMQEITIGNKKNPVKYLGHSLRFEHYTHAIQDGHESVTLVENPFGIEKEIKSFCFYLDRFDNLLPILRVVFYKNENNYPTKAFPQNTNENIFILTEKQKRKIKLDIRKMNVMLPKEGVFVGIECLGMIDPKTKRIVGIEEKHKNNLKKKFIMSTGISFKTSKKQIYSFQRYKFLKNTWRDYNEPDTYKKMKKSNEFETPAFGIEVYE